MSDIATKKDVQKIVNKAVDKAVDDLTGLIHTFMDQVSKKFVEYDEQFRQLNKKYDHLVSTIDGFIARIDRYETEMAARDKQFDRLVEWARKVSEKTGIPLENL